MAIPANKRDEFNNLTEDQQARVQTQVAGMSEQELASRQVAS